MAREALSSSEFLNFIIYDTIPATPYNYNDSLETASFLLENLKPQDHGVSGDQASIVGGAIEFVKELEQLLQSLEAKKLKLHEGITGPNHDIDDATTSSEFPPPPFAQFFVYPQYTWSQTPNKFTSKTKASIAEIEVTLIETHANVRILSRRVSRQLSKLAAGFQTLHLTVLHVNVTTMDPLVLYSISARKGWIAL
ncbi:MAX DIMERIZATION MAD [Salix purpurea]|uniref:MAX DIMERIZATION MAD n=1 Tax=Salix purpurea TaxID=77065 RepID=A0A9Q0YW33_SALPP|nr:MAX DIMERIZATION MAD [Salix purpurea]